MRALPGSRYLLAATLVVASGLPAGSAAARRQSLIAFDRALDGSGRIHVVGLDGRGDRIVTPKPGFEAPRWSPDGLTLVFESGRGPADSELYSYRMSTGTIRRLTHHPGLDAYPAWSPDGSRIAWTANRGGGFAIWVMRRGGTGARRLTSGPADAHPAWSPDGRAIAFVSAASRSLELVRSDGQGRRRIGGGRAFDSSSAPAWSPDGRRLAVAGVDGALYTVATDGHALRRLTPDRPGMVAWRPSWSPRGGQIAFINLADSALDVVDAGTARVHLIARQTDALSTPAWSPDGRFLVFADGSGHLETISSDGRARRILTHGISADANPAWRPS
jgi:Tol biopolymer transport system component